ncbi:sensor histidine kinase [Georgenia deserti]|uniref:Sensor histidine kinase n=1 Tax=Georgenia deserti TaxID=2093781 RepID=A0ABW4KZT4_9MICO
MSEDPDRQQPDVPAEVPALGFERREPPPPWARFAWIMGVVWLVFLAFPIVEVVQSGRPVPWRVAGVAAIVAFAATYVYGFRRLYQLEPGAEARRFSFTVLAGLSALAILSGLLIGPSATGTTTFLLAFTMFSQPLRRAFVMVLGWLGVTVAIIVVGDASQLWFFLVINLGVAFLTGVIRWIDEQQGEHERLQRELDIVGERERVARDVHDVVGHSLTVVTMKAELAERLVDADPAAAKAELAELRAVTRESLAEIRATVAGLRVARLGDELAAARSALDDAGIAADMPDGPDVVDPRHRLVLAWVLREAVTNVVRHSQAATCAVRLGPGRLEVTDDGVGLGGSRESTGLCGIRERVAAAGGRLILDTADGAPASRPGRPGTRLEVLL